MALMRLKLFPILAAAALFTSILFAQTETPPASSPEDTAFHTVTDAYIKLKQGGANQSEESLKLQRESGREIVAKAKQFLKEYPTSKKADDTQSLWSIGLMEAAVAGDSGAADELKTRASEMVKDAKVPDMLKLHVFAVNYITQWAAKNGRRNIDQGSAEFQKVYLEAFFAAANILPNKDDILKMVLLQAKSGRQLSDQDKQDLAQRVLDNPNASEAIKASAKQILSGEKTYAIGKPLELSFTTLDGKKINLADMKGKVVLIDFWATWCGPCVGEMPNVKSVYDKLHAQGFEIIGISLDESKEDLQKFIKKNSISWPQYFDGKQWNNEISSRFGIDAIPAEWLIDKKGILRSTNARGNIEDAATALLKEK
jgi:thiol-disulfide isomerase/thioredoxin